MASRNNPKSNQNILEAMQMQLFGFLLPDAEKEAQKVDVFQNPIEKGIVPSTQDDGAQVIQTVGSGAGFFGTYVDLDGTVKNEVELITKYREMAMQPEMETAIDNIINEAIVTDDQEQSVKINVDNVALPDNIKQTITEEFKNVLKLMNFQHMGHDIFRRWYTDGRLFYQIIIDESQPNLGVKELRYIDPRRIRKIREIQKARDPVSGMEIVKKEIEYYVYNERGLIGSANFGTAQLGARIAVDSIANVNSGLMDSKRTMVISYLHKSIRPLNQLRMMEDAMVILRVTRAPERRVFYIDVGPLAGAKADQYVRDIMNKYRNKLVYNQEDGSIKDSRQYMSMLEDYWLPRRENRSTEIQTLPGQMVSAVDDVTYFKQALYKSMGIPISRLEPTTGFSLGRSTEITRDELAFTKFIQRLRNKFSELFDTLMGVQLVLKNICSKEDWEVIKEDIWYDFLKDTDFADLKENEILMGRLQTLQLIEPFVGKYFSQNWVKKKVLRLSDEEIAEMQFEITQDAAMNAPLGLDAAGNPMATDENGQPLMPPMVTGQDQLQQGQGEQPGASTSDEEQNSGETPAQSQDQNSQPEEDQEPESGDFGRKPNPSGTNDRSKRFTANLEPTS